MPPNNNNLTSALSRQMQRLRQQVDRVDLKMLQLLQQRTKLSGQIGRMKRRHGAVIYVPERERELLARLTHLSKGRLSARAIAALYREILSSSRAAQGQTPIGLLQASADLVLPASRACFGASDRFSPQKTWAGLVKGLDTGALSLVLLSGHDLAGALRMRERQGEFFDSLTVVGDFSPVFEPKASLARRIFIVTPRGNGASRKADRMLILIECKSTVNAIKSLLHSMPDFSIQAELLTASTRRGLVVALARLSLARPADGIRATSRLLAACKSAGIAVSILGIYPGTEEYGG
ncbi:MAG: chorismate mutase [Methylacidiphilales bacterium]|nr:chorismate mutase [Candidatus Methylacidiphilales bacterium]